MMMTCGWMKSIKLHQCCENNFKFSSTEEDFIAGVYEKNEKYELLYNKENF